MATFDYHALAQEYFKAAQFCVDPIGKKTLFGIAELFLETALANDAASAEVLRVSHAR